MKIINEVVNLANAQKNLIIAQALCLPFRQAQEKMLMIGPEASEFEVLEPRKNDSVIIRHIPTRNELMAVFGIGFPKYEELKNIPIYLNTNKVRGTKDARNIDFYSLLTTHDYNKDVRVAGINLMSPKERVKTRLREQQAPAVAEYSKAKEKLILINTPLTNEVIRAVNDFNDVLTRRCEEYIAQLIRVQHAKKIIQDRKIALGKLDKATVSPVFIYLENPLDTPISHVLIMEEKNSKKLLMIIDYTNLVGTPYFGVSMFYGGNGDRTGAYADSLSNILGRLDVWRRYEDYSINTLSLASKYIKTRVNANKKK